MGNFDSSHKEQEKQQQIQETKYNCQQGLECPNCGELNPIDAKFCSECGHSLTGRKKCPKCNAKVSPKADICEVCGEWLLDGVCKFCYSATEPDQVYCSECGNPVNGLTCPKCGKLSFFDFCKYCNIPLTDQAKQAMDEAKKDPEFMNLLDIIESEKPLESEAHETGASDLLKMKEYYSKQVEKKKSSRPLFSDSQKDSIKKMDKRSDDIMRRAEEAKKKAEEENARIEEQKKFMMQEKIEKLKEFLRKTASRTFMSSQQARRYHNSIKPKMTKGWMCNYTATVHPNPEECAEPWHGGCWMI
jgi:hypothetical protein